MGQGNFGTKMEEDMIKRVTIDKNKNLAYRLKKVIEILIKKGIITEKDIKE